MHHCYQGHKTPVLASEASATAATACQHGVPSGSVSLGHTFLSQAEGEYPIGEDRPGALVSVKGSWESGYLEFSVSTGEGRLLRNGKRPKCGKKVLFMQSVWKRHHHSGIQRHISAAGFLD